MRAIEHTPLAVRPLVAAAFLALALLAAVTPRAEAAFPGENGDIVFERYYKGGDEIFSIDPQSGDIRRLTSGAIASGGDVAATEPVYSPDGSRIAFVNAVKRPGVEWRRNDVFVMSADRTDTRRLTRTDGRESDVAFSADGSTIAFKRGREVYAIDADGSNERLLTDEVQRKASEPVFSPDGSRLALTVNTGGDRDIVITEVDGSNPVNLTPGRSEDDFSPAFSPDGTEIAFIGQAVDEETNAFIYDVFVMDAGGSEPQPVSIDPGVEVAEAGLSNLAFSPDGTKFVFSGKVSPKAAPRPFTVGIDGGAAEKLGGAKMNYTYSFDWGVAAP